MEWGFYGRARELQELREILGRKRWFFARITGRRRIGKTTLVQQALRASPGRRVFYVQVPDSAPAGVLSAVRDAMDTFDVPHETHPRPDSLLALAQTIEALVESGSSSPPTKRIAGSDSRPASAMPASSSLTCQG